MRSIFLAFGLVGLGAMSASFAACSSSSDATGGTVTDSGSPDTSVATDSGTPDSGPVDSGTCATCSQILAQGLAAGTPCTQTTPLLSALLGCTCNVNPLGSGGEGLCDGTQADGGDAGSTACSDLCANPTTSTPSTACGACAADQCTSEITACQADAPGGGGDLDAGDGG